MRPVSALSPSVLTLHLLLGIAHGTETGLPPKAEQWFKWGDYDSLIAALEPWVKDTAQASAERAQAYLYLGVAYQANNVRRSSDSAFYKACDLDSGISLDQYYVAPEILDHFRAVAADCRNRKQPHNPLLDAPPAVGRNPGPDSPPSTPGKAPASASGGKREAGSHALLWWAMGGTLAAAALVGGALILLQPEPKPVDSVTVIDGR